MTNTADIIDLLRSQIGDDVQHIYDRDVLFKTAANEIARLRAEVEAAYRRGIEDAASVLINIDGIGPSGLPQRWQDAIRAKVRK